MNTTKHSRLVIFPKPAAPIPEDVIDDLERELPECVDCLPMLVVYSSSGPLSAELFHNGYLLRSISDEELSDPDFDVWNTVIERLKLAHCSWDYPYGHFGPDYRCLTQLANQEGFFPLPEALIHWITRP